MQHLQSQVPEFRNTPPQLLGVADKIAARAAKGPAMNQAALDQMSGKVHETVSSMLEHVKQIGIAADRPVDDCAVALAEVLGVRQPKTSALACPSSVRTDQGTGAEA